MTIELTVEEKTNVINSHLKNAAFSLYNFELSLLEENAKTSPNEDTIKNINNQIEQSKAQVSALEAELASLNG